MPPSTPNVKPSGPKKDPGKQHPAAYPADTASTNNNPSNRPESTKPKYTPSSTGPANKRLWHSTAIVSAMTLLSRIFGFIRDIVLANLFGTSGQFDAFIIAFKIPNLFRRLFAEGAFSQAFVPIFAEYAEHADPARSRLFIQHITGMLSLILLVFIAIAELLAPVILSIFAPGFLDDPQRFALALHMLYITFPYILLISLVALAGGILNTHRQFAVPAFTPVLLNLSLIGCAYFWSPHSAHPITTLAWAVLLGGALQLALQIPFLLRLKQLAKPKFSAHDAGVRRVLKLMVPALFGVSVAQLSLMIDNVFASFLPTGSISWLYYSDRLTYLPLGVIGVALATVILPHLSRLHLSTSRQRFIDTYRWAVRSLLLIGLPAAIGLGMLATPLLTTLFQHGAFNQHSVLMSARSLIAFAIGLPAFMLIKVLASSFYAQKNIKTPVKVAAIALLVNIALNLLLIKPLAHAGLALATSIAAWVNAGILSWRLHKLSHSETPSRASMHHTQPAATSSLTTQAPSDSSNASTGKHYHIVFSLRLICACSVMAIFLYLSPYPYTQWQQWHSISRIGHLAALLISAAAIYFVVLYLVGLRRADLRAP